jgi:hypothetical protein
MGDRVIHAAREVGVGPADLEGLRGAYKAALAPRERGLEALADERRPALLHPGRTVLILVEDVMEVDPRVLAVGALAESRDLQLRASRSAAFTALRSFEFGQEACGWWEGLPFPEWSLAEGHDETDGTLLEALVTAEGAVQRVVLAEALDHLRHAHRWDSPESRNRAVELAERVLHPISARVHPNLARRYAWWTRRVGPALRSSSEERVP